LTDTDHGGSSEGCLRGRRPHDYLPERINDVQWTTAQPLRRWG